jgi:predicted alpha/beta-fold hydrolase
VVDRVESYIEGYQRPIDREILLKLLISFDTTIVDERACIYTANHSWRCYKGCPIEDTSYKVEHSQWCLQFIYVSRYTIGLTNSPLLCHWHFSLRL